jgi:hypothetical protein
LLLFLQLLLSENFSFTSGETKGANQNWSNNWFDRGGKTIFYQRLNKFAIFYRSGFLQMSFFQLKTSY